MTSSLNINIRSIDAFKSISERSIRVIESESKLLNYRIGQPISKNDTIPDQILIILSGEARLLYGTHIRSTTVAKLKSDSFIGLSSILKAKSSELLFTGIPTFLTFDHLLSIFLE